MGCKESKEDQGLEGLKTAEAKEGKKAADVEKAAEAIKAEAVELEDKETKAEADTKKEASNAKSQKKAKAEDKKKTDKEAKKEDGDKKAEKEEKKTDDDAKQKKKKKTAKAEAKKKAEAEAKKKAEAEAKKKAEAEAKKKAEAEAKKKAEAEAKKKAEAEAKSKADDSAKEKVEAKAKTATAEAKPQNVDTDITKLQEVTARLTGVDVEGTDPVARILGAASALEAYHKAKFSANEDGEPPSVAQWKQFCSEHLEAFVALSKKIEGCKNIVEWVSSSFANAGETIAAAAECKKPSDAEFIALLQPCVKVIEASSNPARGDFFNHEKAFGEAVQGLNWLMAPGPKAFIMGQLEAADFYLNKVLIDGKNKGGDTKTQYQEWVKSFKALFSNMAGYCHEYHRSGLMWKVKDGKELSAVVKISTTPAAKPAAAKPKAKAAAKKPAAGAKKKKPPSLTESPQKDKVFIEYYDGKADKELTNKPIEYTCVKQGDKIVCGVFVGNCNDCTVIIKGKAKNVTISGCSKLNIQVENCVTTIEVVNSKQCNVQAIEQCGTFTVDKSDRTKLYLADNSCKGEMSTLVFSSASTSSNLYFSTEDGEDQVEYAVPERFLSTFKIGNTPETKVDSELEMS